MHNKYKYIDYGELIRRPRKFATKYNYLWLDYLTWLNDYDIPKWDEDLYRNKKMREFIRNK